MFLLMQTLDPLYKKWRRNMVLLLNSSKKKGALFLVCISTCYQPQSFSYCHRPCNHWEMTNCYKQLRFVRVCVHAQVYYKERVLEGECRETCTLV
jgi:hypothetical protein